MEDTEWRTQSGRRKQRGSAGRGANSNEMGMDEGHGKRQGVRHGLKKARGMGEEEPRLLLAMFGQTSIILLPFINS